jgi:hypothetical protein
MVLPSQCRWVSLSFAASGETVYRGSHKGEDPHELGLDL